MIKDRISKPLKMSSRLIYEKMLRVRFPPLCRRAVSFGLQKPRSLLLSIPNCKLPAGARTQQVPRRRRGYAVQHRIALRSSWRPALRAFGRSQSYRSAVC